jgi:predicted nucleic acid-binding protein
MLRYMLDTNICIYVIKNRPARLRQRFNELADQLCSSVITLAERIYSAEKSARLQQHGDAQLLDAACICEDLFAGELGASVGIDGALRRILRNR